MMKSYSYEYEKEDGLAFARAESIDASYKDLTQVCGRIRGRHASWAMEFLQKAADGDIPILYKKFNTNLGHRRELGGQKGRYPKKAAEAILKALKSAMANAKVKGLSDDLMIVHVLANKKHTFPRIQAKGRRFRADYEVSRIELVVKGKPSLDKKVEVKAPQVSKEKKQEKLEVKNEQEKTETKHEAKIEVKKDAIGDIKKHEHDKKDTKTVDITKIKRDHGTLQR